MSTQRRRDWTIEMIVGAFAFMVLMLLATFTIILSSQNIFKDYTEFDVQFEDVMGLSAGDSVEVRGLNVGKVTELRLTPNGVLVGVSLESDTVLYDDYQIKIEAGSVLGGKLLSVNPGTSTLPELDLSTVLDGEIPVDLMGEASAAVQSVRESLDQGGILKNLEETMKEVRIISEKLSKGEGTIGKLLMDDTVYNDLTSISANLKQVSDEIANGEGTLAKLISDDSVYENFQAISTDLREVSGRLAKGEGTLGKLTTDDALYDEVRILITEVRATLDDFRETAPITTFSSVFFGAF